MVDEADRPATPESDPPARPDEVERPALPGAEPPVPDKVDRPALPGAEPPEPGPAPAPVDAGAGEPEVVGLVTTGPDGVPTPLYTAPDRPRGLDAIPPEGGDDAADPVRRAREARDLRLLVLFIGLLVGVPTALTFVALFLDLLARRGGG